MAGHWLAELDGSKVTVEVPASSANLGAGYDCLGVALKITNRIELEVRVWSRGEIELTVEGEGRNELTEDRENRFVRGLEAALRAARGELPEGVGWRIAMHNRIPLARGLGSSAAATVGGVLAGNALAGEALSMAGDARDRLRDRGSPGQCRRRAARRVRRVRARRRRASRRSASTRRATCAPSCSSRSCACATDEMRAALPASVPLADAVANLGAVAVGVAGLATGRYDLLARLTVDRLHEPYRAAVYPQLPRMVEAARGAGALGACLSGAGSTILAFADSMAGITRIEAAFFAAAADVDLPGEVVVVEPRNTGGRIVGEADAAEALTGGSTLRAWTDSFVRSVTGSPGSSVARSTPSAGPCAGWSTPATGRSPAACSSPACSSSS